MAVRRRVPIVLPRSRAQIERMAEALVRALAPERLAEAGPLPVIDALDWYARDRFAFDSEVVDSLPAGVEAMTDFEARRIRVASGVYEAAERGDGRARFTLMHEVGHVATIGAEMEMRLGLERSTGLTAQVVAPRCRIAAFEDPEWQADAFALAVLMPRRPFARVLRNTAHGEQAERLAGLFLTTGAAARQRWRVLAAKRWL